MMVKMFILLCPHSMPMRAVCSHAQARARVDHANLRALLFAQGYRADEIVGAG